MRVKDSKSIHKMLCDNAHRFVSPGWMFAYDTNLDRPELWDKAKIKVLLLFLSPGETRAVSSTDIALLSIIKQAVGDAAFVDTCYLPVKHNGDVLDELNLPWAFGNVSHHAMHDYDLVLLSDAVVDEKYNIVPLFDKSDFPMYKDQRINDNLLPLILFGGAGGSEGETLYGKSLDGKHESLVDVTYVGFAEVYFPQLIKDFLQKKTEPGYDKTAFIEYLYKYPNIYNPTAYEHVLAEDKWTIKEIKKKDLHAPDRVEYAHVTEEVANTVAGFELKPLYAEGNYDSVDIQISFGCSGGCNCSFCVAEGTMLMTSLGLKAIELVKVGDMVGTGSGWQKVSKTFKIGAIPTVEVVLKNGDRLLCGRDTHKVETVSGWRLAKDLKPNDRVLVNNIDFSKKLDLSWLDINFEEKDKNFGFVFPEKLTSDLAWLAGYWYGDGCMSKNYVLAVTLDERKYIKGLLKSLFGVGLEWRPYDGPSKKVYKIGVSRCFSRFMKKVTDTVLDSGFCGRDFIGGYVQADGWANSFVGVDIVSSSYEKLDRVRNVARMLGHRCGIKSYDRKPGDGYNSKPTKRVMLHISSNDFRLIGKKPNRMVKRGYVESAVRSVKEVFAVRMYDITVDEPHQYYANFISVMNCHEGQAQAWRQKSLEKIVKEATIARNRSLASTFSCFSFNSNFHTFYEDIMAFASKTFPKVSAIAMRADEIASRPDYFKMDKYLGISRMTLGVEGVSDRIRNGYLGKALERDKIFTAAKACFVNRFMQIKWFFILTGKEEQQDWEEGVKMLKELVDMRETTGANTHMKVSFSILCYYPHTPIAWEERKAIKHVLNDARIPYFIEKCMEMGVGVRFSSRGHSVVFQQLNLDVGRPMTAVYEKMWKDTGWIFYRNIPDPVVDKCIEIIKEQGMPFDRMFDKRPYTWIFPSQVIRVKNEEFLIQASKDINEFKAGEYCMKTQARPVKRGCKNCGLCSTPKERQEMVDRPINQSKATVDEVILNMSLNQPRYRYRFAFEAPQAQDFLVKRPLAHYYFTKYFTDEEKVNVYGVASGANPQRWQYHQDFPYPAHGAYFFDVYTKAAMKLVLRPVENTLLKAVKINEVPLNFDTSYDDMVVTMLSVKPDASFLEGMRNFGVKYPYLKNDMPIEWAVEEGDFPQPMLKKDNDSFKLLMYHPIRANIVKYLAMVTRKPYFKVLEDLFISNRILFYLRPLRGSVCSVCGKSATLDLSTGKQVNFCPECLMKVVYSKI